MSLLQTFLRALPPKSIVTNAMMKDHAAVTRQIDDELLAAQGATSKAQVMAYDILVSWYTGWSKARLKPHSRWHRGVLATSLTEAGEIALSRHTNVVNARVSMCWPQHPQPVELQRQAGRLDP